MEITLGTATFGSDYGIANKSKLLEKDECTQILKKASSLGIRTLDSAPDYGSSEELIGDFHGEYSVFGVYAKISKSVEICDTAMKRAIKHSMYRLRVKQLAGIYFHSPEKLLAGRRSQVSDIISWINDNGISKRVGVSVYTENQIEEISEKFPKMNLFQVPENILDRRLLNSKVVKDQKSNGSEFNVRSVFLQGLLLMPQDKIPPKMKRVCYKISQLQKLAATYQISVESLCLNYAESINWATNIVVGVNSIEQLEKVANYTRMKIDVQTLPPSLDNEILDPRTWARQ